MSKLQKLRNSNLDPDSTARLKFKERVDVNHSTDYFEQNAVKKTNITAFLTDMILNPLLGNNQVLAEMRENGMLEDYKRGSFDFENFVQDVVDENWQDYEWVEALTERHDYKRGTTTVSTTVETTVAAISELADFELVGWTVEVDHPMGILEIEDY